jgi:hypothetical protein
MLSYIKHAVWRGLLAGVFFSLAYIAFVIPFTGLLMVLTNVPAGRGFEAIIGAGILTACAWPFSFFLGVLPGALLGLVGGCVAGCLFAPWRNHLVPPMAAILAAGLTLLALLPIHLIFAPELLDANQAGFARYGTYLFWLVGPSLFAIPAAAWAGWSLQKNWMVVSSSLPSLG